MKLASWFRSRLFRTRKVRRVNHDLRRRPAILERLEDRSLLASFYVALSGNDLNPGTAAMPFRTVQAGINAAALVSDGPDAVNVAAGTYNTPGVDTRFDIPASATLDNLQLLGGWNTGFTVRNPAGTPTDYTFTNSPAANRYDVQVLDTGTTIDGFSLNSNGVAPRDADTILVQATNATVSNNVLNVGTRSSTSEPRPSGVVTSGADVSGLKVQGNVINVNAAAPTNITAAIGVFLNPSAATTAVLIDGNKINGNNMNSGVIVSGLNNVTVQNNTINRNSPVFGAGIELRNNIAAVNNALIVNNSIVDLNTSAANSAGGIVIGGSGGINAPVTNTTIRGNIVSMSGPNSIGLAALTGTVAASTLIERNAITAPTAGNTALSTVVGLDVSGNWLNSATQAGVDAAISGAAGGTIVARSFLSSGADASPAPGLQLPPTTEMIVPQTQATSGLMDVDGRIQSGIDRSLPGMTVRVAADTFTENLTISKAITVIGAVDGANQPLVTLQPALSSNSLVLLSGTSFGADNNVTLKNMLYRGTNGAIKANNGILVNPPTQFGTLTVDNSDFQGFQDIGISVNGDATTGISAHNLVISNSSFSNNGSLGNGGDGDIDAFMYNGDASLSNLKLVGSSVGSTGERLGIQFRGAGNATTGVGQLPSGTISFNGIDISGTYRTQFIGIQDYTDVRNISFNNVKLGGPGSGITGTFGAELRFDGVGLAAGNSTINLGNTYFRANTVGSATIPAPGVAIEFAPDNTYAFLRADATNTRWDTSSHTNIAAGSLSLSELFDVEDRILHYPDALNGGQPYKGFADVRANNAYVTATVPGSSIQRAIDIVTSPGTVNIKAGSYVSNIDATAAGRAIAVSGGPGPVVVTTTGNLALNNIAGGVDSLVVDVNGSMAGPGGYDQLIVNGTVALGNAVLSASGTRADHDGDVLVLIQNDGIDPVTGTFQGLPEGSTVAIGGVTYLITYKYNAEAGTFGNGNDVALVDLSGVTAPAPGSVQLVTDPCDPSKTALVITGTSGDDNIDVKLKGKDTIEVSIDPKGSAPKVKQSFPLSSVTGHIIVYGLAGKDKVDIDNKLTQEAWIFGGDGNDDLKAGDGPTLIVGGNGDDKLHGGKGRDVLIGGDGKDDIHGDGAEDLLIAGSTDYDDPFAPGNVAALCAITDQWTDTATVSSLLTPGGTIHADDDKDELHGDAAVDKYFATLSGANKDNVHADKNETPMSDGPPPAVAAATPTTAALRTSTPAKTVTTPKAPPKVVTTPKPAPKLVTPPKAAPKVVTPPKTKVASLLTSSASKKK
jgi:hypothetical protein